MPLRSVAGMLVGLLAATAPAIYAQAPLPPPPPPSLVGAWTLNKDLSDQPQGQSGGGDRQGGQTGQRGGGGGGRRRGGFGGGFGGGGGGTGGGNPEGNPEDVQRKRNALRDEMQAPDHLTLTQSETTVIITAGDGRTTRLSPDGRKIKDESTGVERRTKWDAGKLVSEISGLGSGKITETYRIDAEHRQLRVTLEIDGPQRKATLTRVYDADLQ
jgi:hypothetical protein